MANNVIKRIWNQNKMVNIEALQGMAFQAEDGGHTFEISGVDGQGNPVALSGTVAGVFVRPDNADIALSGYASDGKVYVTLSDACYAVPGKFGLTIFVTADSKKTAVYAAIGTVTRTSGGAVAGDTPQDVVDLINAIAAAVATIPEDYTDLTQRVDYISANTGVLIDAFSIGDYSGYITNDGTIGANASYHYCELMKTVEGEMWLYDGRNNSGGLYVVWGYSDSEFSNPTPLVPMGTIDDEMIVIVPHGINYIRAFGIVDTQTSRKTRLLHGVNVFFYDSTQGSIRTFFDTYVKNPTMLNRYTVYILPGTYSFDSEFTEAELGNSSFIGVTVPKWTTLIGYNGNPFTIISCTLSSNSISTLNLQTGSSLIGLTIKGQNCRYAIHDDFETEANRNERYMADCIVEADRCSYGYAYGGGCKGGQVYKYERCVFKALDYDGGGYLMHSNTGFTRPTVLEFNNCEFYSLVGHPERAVNIRGLGTSSVINKAIFNNCKADGFYLQKSSFFDWDITGAGNSVCPVATDSDCETNFVDEPYTDTTWTDNYFNALAIGSFRFANGIPQWWNGSSWVKADGTSV